VLLKLVGDEDQVRQAPSPLCFAGIVTDFVCQVQSFSTGVPWNLRVPPVVSTGSVGPPVLSKKKTVFDIRSHWTRFLGS